MTSFTNSFRLNPTHCHRCDAVHSRIIVVGSLLELGAYSLSAIFIGDAAMTLRYEHEYVVMYACWGEIPIDFGFMVIVDVAATKDTDKELYKIQTLLQFLQFNSLTNCRRSESTQK